LDKLPQSKIVIKPTQMADIEASHLYHGRHIVREVTDMEVEPWAIFLVYSHSVRGMSYSWPSNVLHIVT
jgi:hypothetical protein